MNNKLLTHIICSVSFAFSVLGAPAWAGNIIVGGTGNALGTMKRLAIAYEMEHPNTHISVLPSIGSSGAIKAVPAGKIDIGLSARPLKQSEMINGISSIEYARSPLVIALANDSIINDISTAQLADIYAGKIVHWPNGDLIRPILRQANDDNTKQLRQLSPALSEALDIADNRSRILFAATDQEAVDKIERTPGSIGVTSLALILSEERQLHALSLNGIAPTKENSLEGHYPMTKQFYFILPENSPSYVVEFIDFVRSSKGLSLLEKYGNYVPDGDTI